MFDKQAKRIAEAQVELGQISEEEKALIQYGLEAGFGFIAYLVLSLAVGLLSGRLLEAIVFTAAFMCLRPYAGGYHAGSQIRCLVLSTLLTAAALILTVLLQHGLLKVSFVPDRQQRELRELTKYRKSCMEERAREINRLQKMLEGANIKLSSAVTDIMGLSSRKLLELVTSDHPVTLERVEQCMKGHLKASAEELLLSMEGVVTGLQRELIGEVLHVIDEQTAQIARAEALIDKYMDDSYAQAVDAVDTLPGIAKTSAQQIVAEIGIDMSRFPSANHLSSWAGLSPGNNESAGKRKSGRTNHGNKMLKSTMVQCAMVAVKNKNTFFHAQYQRLLVRRGKKRAVVAVAHSMLIAIYHVLSGEPFVDLGADYYNQFGTEKKINSYLAKLKQLGWEPPQAPIS